MRIVLNVWGIISGIMFSMASCGVRVILKCPISCIKCVTSFHRFVIIGQCHRMWNRVPVWLHCLQHRAEVLVWNLASLSGVKYHLSVILFVSSHREVHLVAL